LSGTVITTVLVLTGKTALQWLYIRLAEPSPDARSSAPQRVGSLQDVGIPIERGFPSSAG